MPAARCLAESAPQAPPGTICLVPFHIAVPDGWPAGMPAPPSEPLSETTWQPQPTSTFEFRVDGKRAAAMRQDALVAIRGVAVDRMVRLSIRLDGKAYESFAVDLGREPDRRLCLWLYPHYWHWISRGWDPKLGCRCDASTPAGL